MQKKHFTCFANMSGITLPSVTIIYKTFPPFYFRDKHKKWRILQDFSMHTFNNKKYVYSYMFIRLPPKTKQKQRAYVS